MLHLYSNFRFKVGIYYKYLSIRALNNLEVKEVIIVNNL